MASCSSDRGHDGRSIICRHRVRLVTNDLGGVTHDAALARFGHNDDMGLGIRGERIKRQTTGFVLVHEPVVAEAETSAVPGGNKLFTWTPVAVTVLMLVMVKV